MEFQPFKNLTKRELEIVLLICQAKTNAEIAEELYIQHGSVKTHIRNILSKTGFINRVELAVEYIKHLHQIEIKTIRDSVNQVA